MTTNELTLESLSGPYEATFVALADKHSTIGRAATNDICLLHDGVSRRHATLMHRGNEWYVVNQSARAGTYLNGVRLEESKPSVVVAGDLLRIGPWTFRVRVGRIAPVIAATIDDARASTQRVERASPAFARSDRRLKLLGDCLARLSTAAEETVLARTALDSALEGTGYARGAVLRRAGSGHDVQIVESVRRNAQDRGPFLFSQSLVTQAALGELSILTTTEGFSAQQSIAELRIHSAICAPIFLGGSVEGYMYLDARGQETSVQGEAAGFCDAIARAYGLSLSNLKRIELQKRQHVLEQDIQAAREAQEVMLPAPRGEIGPIRYAMEMRPGLFVAGDLFDVIEIGDGRIAVSVGDVAGHGLGSGMLMALMQSYLHAQLQTTADPLAAVHAVNRYVSDRSAGGKFASLWVGVFSPHHGANSRGVSLAYVDAGHGHWMLRQGGRCAAVPNAAGGIPIGIDPDQQYTVGMLELNAGDRVVVYSDGLTEQKGSDGQMFGADRLLAAIDPGESAVTDVQRAFAAIDQFSGGGNLDDDATVASIEAIVR